MKKVLLFAVVVLFAFGMFACKGGGKYADVKDVMEKFIVGNEKFTAALDKAQRRCRGRADRRDEGYDRAGSENEGSRREVSGDEGHGEPSRRAQAVE